jgi:hypothetical protein
MRLKWDRNEKGEFVSSHGDWSFVITPIELSWELEQTSTKGGRNKELFPSIGSAKRAARKTANIFGPWK